jgi:hypothetical protein
VQSTNHPDTRAVKIQTFIVFTFLQDGDEGRGKVSQGMVLVLWG